MSNWLTIVGGVIVLLTFLGTFALYIGLGAQRGRVRRLEESNDDLRKEVEDEKRRRANVEADLLAARERADQCQTQIDGMQSRLLAMQEVIDGASGPLARMAEQVTRLSETVGVHHAEAMAGMDYMFALQIDAMRLMGDTRNPARIRAEIRAKERASDARPDE